LITYKEVLRFKSRAFDIKCLRSVFKGRRAHLVVKRGDALFWYPEGFDPFGDKVVLSPPSGPSLVLAHLAAISQKPWTLQVSTGVDWVCVTYASTTLPLDTMSRLSGNPAYS